MPSVITLTTDFGLSDAYVACMKGVILGINPKITIVDISHSVEPQNIAQAAFILHIAYRYFPADAIHVVIVDPGVGSQREAIILSTPSACFVAPDNGVLSYIIDELHPLDDIFSCHESRVHLVKSVTENIKAISITNPTYWCQPVSNTFHGRDIFAPVAAHLSLGVPIQEFGEEVNSLNAFSLLIPHYDSTENLVGHVLYIDHFGNLITNIRNIDFSQKNVTVKIGKHLIIGINRSYAEIKGLAVISGSSGYLEISLSSGNAAASLKARVGDQVKLTINRRK